MNRQSIIAEVAGLYRILPLTLMRQTAKVTFDCAPMAFLPRIDAIDRVIHQGDAVSPGAVGEVERPWYMHPCQEDNLIVLYGSREVEITNQAHRQIERFTVTPQEIHHNGKLIHQGGAMLVWPCSVFHRIRSGAEGSASLNFAVHTPGFDLRTNFNIYDLDPESGEFRVIREGHRDQFPLAVGAP